MNNKNEGKFVQRTRECYITTDIKGIGNVEDIGDIRDIEDIGDIRDIGNVRYTYY